MLFNHEMLKGLSNKAFAKLGLTDVVYYDAMEQCGGEIIYRLFTADGECIGESRSVQELLDIIGDDELKAYRIQ